jgi:hypothetical protein
MYTMKRPIKLAGYFPLPKRNETNETELFIMKNGVPVYCVISIFGATSQYIITTEVKDGDELKLIFNSEVLCLRYSQEEYEVFKSINIHLKELLRYSDIGPVLNRLYGVLSIQLIRKYLDEFITESLKHEYNDSETFAARYISMRNTLIRSLNTRTKDILNAIVEDYPLPDTNNRKFIEYSKSDAIATNTWAIRVSGSISGGEVKNKSIRNLWGLLW